MKSQFRSQAAAAILLAALGAGFVATPASAEPVVVARSTGAPGGLLHRFDVTVNQTGLRPGIIYRVYGVPGANVIVDLPGIGPVTASEVQPGTYEAGLSLRRGERNLFPPATAVLRINSSQEIARIPAINAGDPNLAHAAPVPVQPPRVVAVPPPRVVPVPPQQQPRDVRGPEIANVFPAQGERVSERGRTRVTAQFRDDRAGVDPNSVRLRVDGRDVTRDSRINGEGIEYRDDLAPGNHTAELTLRDRSGNATRRTWTFEVVDARGNARPGNGWGDRNHEHTGSRGDESRR